MQVNLYLIFNIYFSTWIVIALCTISTVAAFEALNVSYTYTKEIFPTVRQAYVVCYWVNLVQSSIINYR